MDLSFDANYTYSKALDHLERHLHSARRCRLDQPTDSLTAAARLRSGGFQHQAPFRGQLQLRLTIPKDESVDRRLVGVGIVTAQSGVLFLGL